MAVGELSSMFLSVAIRLTSVDAVLKNARKVDGEQAILSKPNNQYDIEHVPNAVHLFELTAVRVQTGCSM